MQTIFSWSNEFIYINKLQLETSQPCEIDSCFTDILPLCCLCTIFYLNWKLFLWWNCLFPYQLNILTYLTDRQPLACFNKMWTSVIKLVSHWEQINNTITANVRNWRLKFPPIFKIQRPLSYFPASGCYPWLQRKCGDQGYKRAISHDKHIQNTSVPDTESHHINLKLSEKYFDGFYHKL